MTTPIEMPAPTPMETNPSRLEPMLVRLPPQFADGIRKLARRTRVRQSDYLREAVADLLAKYGQKPDEQESHPSSVG